MSLVPEQDYQHLCLHNALQVRYDADSEQYVDVNRVSSNLFEKESHADRLLSHYIANYSTLKDETVPGCCCNGHIDSLKKDILYGIVPARGSLRETLHRRIKTMNL